MAATHIYLNFAGNTEEAFTFYRSVFGGEFSSLRRFSDYPDLPEHENMTEEERRGIMHIELPLLGGVKLMGTEAPKSIWPKFMVGSNMYIYLETDTREEADRLHKALSEGGTVGMPMQETFWGAYYGDLTDKYGVRWMVSFADQSMK